MLNQTLSKRTWRAAFIAACLAVVVAALPNGARAAEKPGDGFSTDTNRFRSKMADTPAPPAPQAVSPEKKESTEEQITRLIDEKIRLSPALMRLGFKVVDQPSVSVTMCHNYSPLNPLRLVIKGFPKWVLSHGLFRQYLRDVTMTLSYQGVRHIIRCEAQVGMDFRRVVVNECNPTHEEFKQGQAVYYAYYSEIKGWPIKAEERSEGKSAANSQWVRAIPFGDETTGWDMLVSWTAD